MLVFQLRQQKIEMYLMGVYSINEKWNHEHLFVRGNIIGQNFPTNMFHMEMLPILEANHYKNNPESLLEKR